MKKREKKANTLKRIMAILLAMVMMSSFTVTLADSTAPTGGGEPCDVCNEEIGDCVCPIAQPEICADCGQEKSDCECTAADGGAGEDGFMLFAPSSFDICLECGEAEDDCVCTVTVSAVPEAVSTLDELLEAIAIAEQNGDAATILLTAQIDIPAGQTAEIKSDVPITLTVDGNRRHFYVEGTLTMGDGITLTRADGYTGVGGGVDVRGTFIMLGGLITNNSTNSSGIGGGVVVRGNFIMRGGAITDNKASAGGGVNLTGSSEFTMYGGTISGNTANMGGGVRVYEGCVFNMNGGIISGNTATGATGGGGVMAYSLSSAAVAAVFNMTGGTISGNTATNTGGGLYVYMTAVGNMTGGTISGNTATNGGGVTISSDSSLNMTGGTISGNTATNGGGAIRNFGTFDMTGGTISDNSAPRGGGIFVPNGLSGLSTTFINPASSGSVVFSNNTATGAAIDGIYRVNPASALYPVYTANITQPDNSWSYSLQHGYNNHDIGAATFGTSEFQRLNTITFNFISANETPENTLRTVLSGESISSADMPTVPDRENFVFLGWNTETDGNGSEFKADTIVTGDIAVYAIYEAATAPGSAGDPGAVGDGAHAADNTAANGGDDAANSDSQDENKAQSQDAGDSFVIKVEDGNDSQISSQPAAEAATANTETTSEPTSAKSTEQTTAPTTRPKFEMIPEPTPEKSQSDDGFGGDEYVSANNPQIPLANIGERQAINNGLSSLSVLAMANIAALLVLLALLFLFVVWKRRDEEEEEEIAEIKEGEEY